MRARAGVLSLALLLSAILSMMLEGRPSAHGTPPKRMVLMQRDLDDIEGGEGTLYIAEIAPGAVTGKHRQPATEIGYVLEGAIFIVSNGRPSVTLRAGEGFLNPGKGVYNLTNLSMTDPAKILVFAIGRKGESLAVPEH